MAGVIDTIGAWYGDLLSVFSGEGTLAVQVLIFAIGLAFHPS